MLKNILLFSILLSNSSYASDKVIYGVDNRQDVSAHADAQIRKMANSVAALVDPEYIQLDDSGDSYQLTKKYLRDQRPYCGHLPFLNQLAVADCTGFLVAPDILLTAGHCMTVYGTCKRFKWVFGYNQERLSNSNGYSIPKEQVYSCKKLMDYTLNSETKNDYAIIKLDRPVKDRTPLAIRSKGESIEINTDVFVIGHPSGLPTKIADDAIVRSNDNPIYFGTNLDTFGGNSGSPVFNAQEGFVEGILVRGEQDYQYDELNKCYLNKICNEDECVGESVTRITQLDDIYKIIDESYHRSE